MHNMNNRSKINFNSIKVRLKPNHQNLHKLYENHFNSIKVRLKLKANGTSTLSCSFQFHKGTIKT